MILYGGDYEHTLDLSRLIDGHRLQYRVLDRSELFAKVLKRQEFDVCEFSLSNYIMMRDRGADWLTAVPIFPSRAFRHGTMLVSRDSPVEQFGDLKGKRIGIPDYTMTAGVWGRGILAEYHDLHWSDITWFSAGVPRFAPPSRAGVLPLQGDLEEALATGEIDALFHPRSRDASLPPNERRFRTLLRHPEAEERRYFQRTRIYPISHVVVLPREVIATHPTLPAAVTVAYQLSKKQAIDRRLSATYLPWGATAWRKTQEIFGDDPMPYGLSPENRAVVEKLQDYLLEQGLIDRRQSISDLFVETGDAAGITA